MVEIVQTEPGSAGLDGVLAGMLLAAAADPSKAAVLARMSGSLRISVTDLVTELRIEFEAGRVSVSEDAKPADLHLCVSSTRLLALATVPRIGGVPSPLHADGRRFFVGLVTRKVRIRGWRHARLLNQLMAVLGT